MTKEDSKEIKQTTGGKVKISNQVISNLVGVATVEINGVAGMSGGLKGGIARLLGRDNLSKGVKVQVDSELNQAIIDLDVIVKRDYKLHEVAREIQDAVQESIEDKTGLEVAEVNVNVQGIDFELEEDSEADQNSS